MVYSGLVTDCLKIGSVVKTGLSSDGCAEPSCMFFNYNTFKLRASPSPCLVVGAKPVDTVRLLRVGVPAFMSSLSLSRPPDP